MPSGVHNGPRGARRNSGRIKLPPHLNHLRGKERQRVYHQLWRKANPQYMKTYWRKLSAESKQKKAINQIAWVYSPRSASA